MPRYLLAYHGGHVDESQEGRERVMQEFGKWFAELGERLVDPGNPIARAVTVDGGTVSDGGGSNPVSGYTVIEADDMDRAIELVKRGPIVQGGRTVEIAEATTAL
jgi:hypothetical protein